MNDRVKIIVDEKFYKRILNSSEEKLVELNQFQDKISSILTPRVY